MLRYVMIAPLAAGAAQAAIVPDRSFGGTGQADVEFPDKYSQETPTLTRLADRSVVVASGRRYDPDNGSAPRGFAIGKLSASGVVDTTFGSGGVVVVPLAGAIDITVASEVQELPDGRLLLLGEANTNTETADPRTAIVVVRLLSDGALDPTFNGGTPLRLADRTPQRRTYMLRQRDAVLVFELGDAGGATEIDVTRIGANGVIDANFASGGTLSEPAAPTYATDAMMLASGGFQILHVSLESGVETRSRWRRYRAEGALDVAYGTGGERAIWSHPYRVLDSVYPLGDDSYVATGGAAGVGLLDAEGEFTQRFQWGTYPIKSVLPFGVDQLLVTSRHIVGFIPTPAEGDYVHLIDREGRRDTAFGANGQFRVSSPASHMASYATAVDGPTHFLMARTAIDGVTVLRYEDRRGQTATTIPALGPLALALLALGCVISSRRRAPR